MSLNLDTLLADYNGSAMAVAGHAEWGFIPADWYVAIPDGAIVPNAMSPNKSQFSDTLPQKAFLLANYHRCRTAAGSNEVALFVAMLRAHLVEQGVLIADTKARAVVEDEYVVVKPANGSWDDPANQIPDIPSARDIAKYIKHHANTIVHQMVYVFSARGHHWDPVYNELYERLKKACFNQGPGGFQMPSNEVLYRMAIHGFGIRALTALTAYDKENGRMAAAMFLRYEPAPPLAGTAQITTLMATINTMKQDAWYGAFKNRFDASIKAIEAEVTRIHTGGYRYHVAAKVFGYDRRVPVSPEATDAFKTLCQFALGYIDHLGRKHTLSGQMAITQKSGGPRGIADSFMKACDKFSKPDANVADMATFLASV